LSTDIDQARTYYVTPLSPGDNPGIQSCNYYFIANDKWQVAAKPLNCYPSSLLNMVQLDVKNPPLPLANSPIDLGAIDSTAVLYAAVARTNGESLGLQNLFQASANRSIQVPVGLNSTRGLILLFAVSGNTGSLRATTDPQITNGGPG
jgi:hypothetical protein